MVSRNEWTAQPPERDQIPLKLPVDRLVIAHTNTTSCNTRVSKPIGPNENAHKLNVNAFLPLFFLSIELLGKLFVNCSNDSS